MQFHAPLVALAHGSWDECSNSGMHFSQSGRGDRELARLCAINNDNNTTIQGDSLLKDVALHALVVEVGPQLRVALQQHRVPFWDG